MPNWSGSMLTTKGQALQAKVDAGQTSLILTKMKIGSGVLADGQSIANLTDLISPQQNVPISGISAADNITTVTGVITNIGLSAGFYVRELGLFATDPTEGEILYSMIIDSAPDYLPPEGGAVTVSEEFAYHIIVSNASSVTATINQNGLVTAAILAAHNTDINAHSLAMGFWQASHVYAVGDVIRTRIYGSYKYMECTVAGTTAATEPTWPAVGSTVTDGTVTWAVRDKRVADAQFDNSTKLATTKFVKDSGLQASALKGITGATTTLAAADCGKVISPYASTNQTITLPLCSACPDGSILTIICNATSKITLSRQGTDVIVVNANPVGISSLVLNEGDSLILVSSNANAKWYAIGGSAQIIAAGSIVSSGTGWTKFADGTMIQTGTISMASGAASVNVTFPLAFIAAPTVIPTEIDAAGWLTTSCSVYGCLNTTTTGTTIAGRIISGGTVSSPGGIGSRWIAIGRWKA